MQEEQISCGGCFQRRRRILRTLHPVLLAQKQQSKVLVMSRLGVVIFEADLGEAMRVDHVREWERCLTAVYHLAWEVIPDFQVPGGWIC